MELTPAGRYTAVPGLDAGNYRRHDLHSPSRLWPEKNCYADLWIEILHARGQDPIALLPFTVNVDFEGDQWTFFKPSHDDLLRLYGVKVHELTIWRPLADHVREHLAAGRLVSLEVDAFWLPDTQGTDYRHKHSKTTIAINTADFATEVLGYFHNAGYHEARQADFRQLLKLEPTAPELPLFAELVSFYPRAIADARALKQASLEIMHRQLPYGPASNPVQRFAQRFVDDLPKLQADGLDNYHAWAFAGIRQWGAAYELMACWLAWMGDTLPADAEDLAQQFLQMSQEAKTLILKGARAVMSKKPFDPMLQLQGPIDAWMPLMERLRRLVA